MPATAELPTEASVPECSDPPHRWALGTPEPGVPHVEGVCRKCDATTTFPVHMPEYGFNNSSGKKRVGLHGVRNQLRPCSRCGENTSDHRDPPLCAACRDAENRQKGKRGTL